MTQKKSYLEDYQRIQISTRKVEPKAPVYMGFKTDTGDLFKGRWIPENKAFVFIPPGLRGDIMIDGFYGLTPEVNANKIAKPISFSVHLNRKRLQTFTLDCYGKFSFKLNYSERILKNGENRIKISLNKFRLRSFFANLGRSHLYFIFPETIRKFLNKYINETGKRRFKISKIGIGGFGLIDFNATKVFLPATSFLEEKRTLGVNIASHFRHQNGITEGARLAAKAAQHVGIATKLIELRTYCASPYDKNILAGQLTTDNSYPVNIFHIDPGSTDNIPRVHGSKIFENKLNIGYWAWELSEFPDEYIRNFDFIEEVWTPSDFARDVIMIKSPVPVLTMPHPVQFECEGITEKSEFNLPKNAFVFLCMYDYGSNQDRKNPHAAIDSFLKAFSDNHSAHLLVKVHNAKDEFPDYNKLKEHVSTIPNVSLLNVTLERNQIYELIKHCDVLVSLHRSEGFGLGLAEAMYLGKPVVSTNWSAPAEFINVNNGCPVDYELVKLEHDAGHYRAGQVWADPDTDHAAHLMKKLYEDKDFYRSLSINAAQSIRENFSFEAIGNKMLARLNAMLGW